MKLCWSSASWVVRKTVCKGEGEKKHSMSSNCSTIQQKMGGVELQDIMLLLY